MEEPSGRAGVAAWGDEHVDDLAVMVDRPVDVASLPGNLDVGLIGRQPPSEVLDVLGLGAAQPEQQVHVQAPFL